MFRAAALVLLVAVASVGSAGCGDEPTPVSQDGLDGRAFVSTSLTGRELVPRTELRLAFSGGRLGANAGCNSVGGAYVVEDGVLRQEEGARTLMSCGGEVDAQEAWFVELLSEGARVTKLEHTLTLERAGVKAVFRDAGPVSATGTPDVVGTAWSLVGAEPRSGEPLAVPQTKPPTLELTADGKAAVFAGCNRGGGPAVFKDGFVTFGAIATTRRACDPARDELERFVLGVLSGQVAAGFDGERRLSLAKDGDRLLFAAR